MPGMFSKKEKTTEQTSSKGQHSNTSTFDPWVTNSGKNLYNTAWNQYNKSTTAAPTNATEQVGQNFATNYLKANSGINFGDLGTGAVRDAMNSYAADYENPYTEEVIGKTMDDMRRELAIERERLKSAETLGGAYGGDRHNILEGEQFGNWLSKIGQVTSGLRSDAFDKARGFAQNAVGQDLAYRSQANQANQGWAQFLDQLGARKWSRQNENPFNNLLKVGEILGGVPKTVYDSGTESSEGTGTTTRTSRDSTASIASKIGMALAMGF